VCCTCPIRSAVRTRFARLLSVLCGPPGGTAGRSVRPILGPDRPGGNSSPGGL
jgi:hypothetical protein